MKTITKITAKIRNVVTLNVGAIARRCADSAEVGGGAMLSSPPRRLQWRFSALSLCMIFALAGCGGGGGGGGSNPPTDPPMNPNPNPDPTTSIFPDQPTPAAFATAKSAAQNHYEYTGRYTVAGTTYTSNHLDHINAADAYARGATGAGETVVVVDSGIDAGHREFSGGKVTVVTGIGNSCSPIDARNGRCSDSDHGTATASVIAGRRGTSSSGDNMHGVAFDATIRFIPIRLSTGTPDPSSPPLLSINAYRWGPNDGSGFDNSANFRRYIAQGEIINFSFGSRWALSEWRRLGDNCGAISEFGNYACFRHYYKPNIDALAQAGTAAADRSIFVISAGNNQGNRHDRTIAFDRQGVLIDASSPSASSSFAAAFQRPGDPDLRHILNVVAVGANGVISSYSNRCGEAKSFCIAAPGGDSRDSGDNGISVALPNDFYMGYDGTSFAAPMVSGGLALLRQYFNGNVGNTELVQRILATADSTGRYSNSNIYGHGMLDLDAATRPVGTLMTSFHDDPAARPLGGEIALSGGAFGAGLSRALAAVSVTGFDELGAPFTHVADASVRPAVPVSGAAMRVCGGWCERVFGAANHRAVAAN